MSTREMVSRQTSLLNLSWMCFLDHSITSVFALVLVLGFVAASSAQDQPKKITPKGTISDVNKRPLEGVQVTLHRWDGVYSPPIATTQTDAEGKFEFPTRANDAYYYVIFQKDSFATIDQPVSVDGPIKSTLRSTVQSWIDIEGTSGESLSGARIFSISIRSDDNAQSFVWRGAEQFFGMELKPSDGSGRLTLPPLPEGATVDIRIDHPERAMTFLKNFKITPGSLGSAKLTNGVMTTFEFIVDHRAPMELDGTSCEVMLVASGSDSAKSLFQLPMPISANSIQFCAHPIKYDRVGLKIAGATVTPNEVSLTIAPGKDQKFQFLVRKKVKTTGLVTHLDGTPHADAEILAMTENLSPDGVESNKEKLAVGGLTETDADGKFTVELPVGYCRIEVNAEGTIPNVDYFEQEIQPDSANIIPTFVTRPLSPINGVVIDEDGRPVRDALVRVRHQGVIDNPQTTGADGTFQISLRRVPIDSSSRKRQFELDVAAYTTDRALMGVTRIDLRHLDGDKQVKIQLRPEPSTSALLSMDDNRWLDARKKEWRSEEKRESYPAGEEGKVAPELDGVAWLNTNARSLKDFRGRYVLLDFWFIGCGPCHADLPNVKLVHERFANQGVTVIGVHDRTSSPEIVQEFCQKHDITYPTVVDQKDGRIVDMYRQLGLTGFPTYILLDPEGKVLVNDSTSDGSSLRRFKVEIIRQILNERTRN